MCPCTPKERDTAHWPTPWWYSVAWFYLSPQIFQKNYKILQWRGHRRHGFWVSTLLTLPSQADYSYLHLASRERNGVRGSALLCAYRSATGSDLDNTERYTQNTETRGRLRGGLQSWASTGYTGKGSGRGLAIERLSASPGGGERTEGNKRTP